MHRYAKRDKKIDRQIIRLIKELGQNIGVTDFFYVLEIMY